MQAELYSPTVHVNLLFYRGKGFMHSCLDRAKLGFTQSLVLYILRVMPM